MVSQPDFVVVDDTSTAQPEQIKYLSGWTQKNSVGSVGNTGPPLYQTLHVATSQTSFTFTFNGAAGPLFVMGSVQGSVPSWTCTIDNKPMSSISNGGEPSIQNANHVTLCSNSQTTPVGDHTIKVSVVASESNPAFFDYILYTPPSKVRPGDLIFDSSNQGITYGPNWSQDGNNGMITSSPGESFDFTFIGHSVSWIGFYDGNLGKGSSNAVYSIDGGSQVGFTIDNIANGDTVLTEQVFFQSRSLGSGQHHIQVVYQGATGSTPLTLDRLIVQNSTIDFQLPPFQANVQGGSSSQVSGSNGSGSPDTGSSGNDSPASGSSGSDSPASGSNGSDGPFAIGTGNGQQATITLSGGTLISTSPSFSTTIAGRPSTESFLSTTLELKPSFVPHSTASAIPNGLKPRHLRGSEIAGILIAIFGLLGIAIFLLRCRILKHRAQVSQNVSRLARPFSQSDRPPPVPEKGHVQQPSATITLLSDVERQSNPNYNLRPSKARRLAEATASAIRRYRSRSTVEVSYATESPLNERPSRIVMHQDSGVQLPQPVGDVEVIEVPPSYASIK